jgi:hypothetical protein
MKHTFIVYAILALLALPVVAPAETPGSHGGQHLMAQPGAAPMMHGQVIMLGEQTVEGVKGMAHIKDVGAMMAQLGKKENYHFMMLFSDAKTGASIEHGTVAVKITTQKTGQAGEAIPLMGMSGHFGADIALPDKGEYSFQVGSKLADGSKRQFTFKYVVK